VALGMVNFDAHSLSFVIRWVHVFSMAFLLGGAALLWILFWSAQSSRQPENDRMLLVVAERYEWFFWLAIGLLVMSGVGNLGALGKALPKRQTAWGGTLIVKLSLVLILVVCSLLRTLLITHLKATGHWALSTSGHKMLQGAYASTLLVVVVVLTLALSLAHG